jgi:single-strand DNA-binding protein
LGIATNRAWTTDSGEKKEEVEYHRVVAWNKLAELCSQLLSKGSKVYVHGRLTTRSWTAQDGTQKSTTEVVIDDMIVLSGKREGTEAPADRSAQQPAAGSTQPAQQSQGVQQNGSPAEDISPDDIPF